MDKTECASILKYLVEKYVDEPKKTDLLESIEKNSSYSPPVRYIINELYSGNYTISNSDKIKVEDTMHWFG